MVLAAQWNNSTLKASYTAATSKAQMADDEITAVCAHCTDVQPAWIDVTFTGMTIGWACCNPPDLYLDASCTADSVNTTYRIPHSAGCVYTTEVSVNATVSYYLSLDGNCDGPPSNPPATATVGDVTLTLTAAGIDVLFTVDLVREAVTDTISVFVGSIVYTDDDVCGDTSNSISNTVTACFVGTTFRVFYGGSASVSIGF